MKLLLSICLLTTAFQAANAEELAECRDPEGPAYFHFAGGLTKERSGWEKDKITGGRISLIRSGDQFDMLYTDIRAKPISMVADGGRVVLLRISEEAATVLVNYERSTEIYTFFREKDGRFKYTMFQSKTGDGTPVPKSSLLLGDCAPFKFTGIK